MKNIVVLGSGRSGTSMVAGCFAQAGYYMGTGLYKSRESNPKGFFESPAINTINELILDTIPENLYTFRPIFGHRWTAAISAGAAFPDAGQPIDRIKETVDRQPFCLKDPRFSYTLPVWCPYLQNTAFICVFREPDNTAVSLVKEVNSVRASSGIPTEMTYSQALATWRSMYASILRLDRSGANWLFVHYDQLLDGSAFESLEALAETRLDRAFPDTRLNRSIAPGVSQDPEIHQIYKELCSLSHYRQADAPRRNVSPEARGDRSGPPVPTLSAVVLSKNGAGRIERCLGSIVEAGVADELVVCVDSETTDNTVEIALRFTRHVYLMRTHGYIESSLREMASLCGGRLILRIDDDERLGGNWAHASLETFARFNDITHFWIPRRWIVPPGDRFIATRPWFPDFQLRLARNDPDATVWPTRIHAPLEVRGRGIVLTDRWIEHDDFVINSRAERESKCSRYQLLRPEKHSSHMYLWEDREVQFGPATWEGFRTAIESSTPGGNPSVTGSPAPYEIGSEIRFETGGNASQYCGIGWSAPESWGTWTDGYRAELRLPFKEAPRAALELRVEAGAYITSSHPKLRVCVVCGHMVIGEWQIESSEVARRSVTVPAALVRGESQLTVAFQIVNPASPSELGESIDGRPLGLGFRKLSLHSVAYNG